MLAACHPSGTPAAVATRSASANAEAEGQSTASGITLGDARLILPAVKGRPAAVYFTLSNATDAAVTLVGATVAGAQMAQMHETSGGTMSAIASVDVPPGGQARFAPGGRHLMVIGLPAMVHPGDTPGLTLTLAGGTTLSAPLSVRPVGTVDPMVGMKMDH